MCLRVRSRLHAGTAYNNIDNACAFALCSHVIFFKTMRRHPPALCPASDKPEYLSGDSPGVLPKHVANHSSALTQLTKQLLVPGDFCLFISSDFSHRDVTKPEDSGRMWNHYTWLWKHSSAFILLNKKPQILLSQSFFFYLLSCKLSGILQK